MSILPPTPRPDRHPADILIDLLARLLEQKIREIHAHRVIAGAIIDARKPMFSKLQGAAAAFDRLHHDLETEAEKFVDEVEDARVHGKGTFQRGRERLAEAREHLKGVNTMLDNLDKATNGGPTLGDSQESSQASGEK